VYGAILDYGGRSSKVIEILYQYQYIIRGWPLCFEMLWVSSQDIRGSFGPDRNLVRMILFKKCLIPRT